MGCIVGRLVDLDDDEDIIMLMLPFADILMELMDSILLILQLLLLGDIIENMIFILMLLFGDMMNFTEDLERMDFILVLLPIFGDILELITDDDLGERLRRLGDDDIVELIMDFEELMRLFDDGDDMELIMLLVLLLLDDLELIIPILKSRPLGNDAPW